jgi:DNA-binding transcriptional regulator YiaG
MSDKLEHRGDESTTRQIHCCDNPDPRIDLCEPSPYESMPEVVLIGVSVRRCQNCPTEATLIPKRQDLDKAIAQRVLLKSASLCGRELQFLRKASHLTIEAMSELLGVSRNTLIAWEASAALRYTNDLAVRVVIAAVIVPDDGPHLIHQILKSIRIGNVDLEPILARWSGVDERWVIEPGRIQAHSSYSDADPLMNT